MNKIFRFDTKKNGCTDTSNQPYNALAEIYDKVMDHVNYGSWAEYIDALIKKSGLPVKKILEIACGTGNLSVELFKLGYSVTGMDISPPMLFNAARKFRKMSMPVSLFSSSMISIPLKYEFDAVICIYDSINYLLTEKEFARVLKEVASVLENGGIFIFDVCTIKNSELYFSDNSMVEYVGDISYERICRYNPKKRMQYNYFVINKQGHRFVENHNQKIYRLDEIRSLIKKSPFRERGRYDDMSFFPGTEESERVHFILQKIR